MQNTRPLLLESDFPPVIRSELQTLQVNLGYVCNMSCVHCHVNAGPNRTESMDLETIEQVLALLARESIGLLDLTGGAPELNPHFRYLVRQARALGVRVIDRCNLTVLFEPGQEDLAEFLAEHQVEICASLPCYLEDNVEEQQTDALPGQQRQHLFDCFKIHRLSAIRTCVNVAVHTAHVAHIAQINLQCL